MPFERQTQTSPEIAIISNLLENGDDMDNEAVQLRILESGSPEELETLRRYAEFRNGTPVSHELMELERAFARQRSRHIDENCLEVDARREQAPLASDIEYAIGTYREWLEKPVRDAVLLLRKKGYASYESGFMALESQGISFDAPISDFSTFTFSERARALFKETGADVYLKDNAVGFQMQRLMSDDELKLVWDTIAAELPTLEHPQPMTSLPNAVLFRKKQDALRHALAKRDESV